LTCIREIGKCIWSFLCAILCCRFDQ
jgi:hypothetical protein